VLFADLAGFTGLAERLDPEDAKALAERCVERLAEAIHRFGGTVLDVAGDQVFAVFGAPVAHEDDAERAVRAALAICDCLLVEVVGDARRAHVGLNTGEVMAGEIGPAAHRQYTVMGDVTNTAARLCAAAPPGSVLVGAETYQATRRAIAYRALPPVAAKGKETPIPAWEALHAASLPKTRPLGASPFVGRAEELALLAGIWTKVAREARPRLVTVVGEPGIGKSRLVIEFERRLPAEATVLHGRCLPYGEVLGYWALATALKEAAGITAEDDPVTARAKLGELVGQAIGPTDRPGDPTEIARHLALLGGLDVEADRAAPAPDQRRLHISVRQFLEAYARRRPLCLLLEDIHWADDALLDLIEFVAGRVQASPMLVLVQARPELLELRPAWGRGVRAFTSLSLEPLDEPSARELVLALCRERGLPPEMAEQIGRGAGGNPLFAEELVAMVAERGVVGIPSAIKTLIASRLDAFPAEERRALQLAAVFGKSFWEDGVRALGVGGEAPAPFEALERHDLVRAQARAQLPHEREYTFKHDLIRDVAYETLPRAERRRLHGRAADWLEQAAGERVEEALALLAHHALEADQPERALTYLGRAAERAGRAAAHREEAALLARAIEIADRLGRDDLVADLRARRGRAFAHVGMWAEARAELEAALAALGPQRTEARAQALVDVAEVCFWSLSPPDLRQYASEALALADEIGRDDLAACAMAWLAESAKIEGDLAAAAERYRGAIARVGGVRVGPLAHAPLTLYLFGQYDEALEVGHASLHLARGMGQGIVDTLTTMYALPHLGLALAAKGRYDEAARVFDEARRFGREYEVGHFLARSIAMSAGFHLDVFDYAGNEALAEEARELARSAGFPPAVVSPGIDLLLNLARRREVGRAERLVDEVAEMAAAVAGWHGWLWDLRLVEARAEIALARGDWEAARRWAEDAIARAGRANRVKYRAAGLGTRALALDALGRTKEAIADLRGAVALARPTGDPAMFLRAAAALLTIDGDDALAAEARRAAERIAGALPDDEMRRRFLATDPAPMARSRA
jgi:class 3 adenylate cyclase/tetratricopeptide (TPR) repeat protein